ncbi:MAG TPA: hemolysin III family protein [Candidatus Lokiarchaeia archaeon]|nr:hemolysin III family protein [Candidatus Lokiarchaeia archaeon]
MVLPSDRWSARFNATGLVFYACGLPFLLYFAASTGSTIKLALAILFAMTSMYFWIVQTFYHVLKREDSNLETMRRVDHTTVFFMIDGVFTSVIAVFGEGVFYIVVIIILWAITIIGSTLMVWWKSGPRSLSSILSFGMGILGIVAISSFITRLPLASTITFCIGVSLLFVGGGAYAIKKPNPIPGLFTFHEIYHGLSLPAIISLFFLVFFVLSH